MSEHFSNDLDSLHQIFQYLVPLLAVIVTAISFMRYKQNMTSLTGVKDFKIRLGQYKLHFIAHLSLLVGGGIFAIISFMTTGVVWYLIVTLAMAILLWFVRPTREKIALDAMLNHKEKMLLDDPNAIIAIVQVQPK